MPHLLPVEASAVSTVQSGSKQIVPTVAPAHFSAPLYFGLDHVELQRGDDRIMAVPHVILINLTLVDLQILKVQFAGD